MIFVIKCVTGGGYFKIIHLVAKRAAQAFLKPSAIVPFLSCGKFLKMCRSLTFSKKILSHRLAVSSSVLKKNLRFPLYLVRR